MEYGEPVGPPDRAGNAISPRSFVVAVIAALLVTAAVYVVGKSLPRSYQASGTFRVTVPNQQGINDTVVAAANDLATQYAQLATAQPVLSDVARKLKMPASKLAGTISASTVAAQNLVQVTAIGSSATVANSRAHAALEALVSYIQTINTSQSLSYARNVTSGLGPINKQIVRLTNRLNQDSANQRQSDLVILASLLGQRQQATQTVATDTAGGQPGIQVVSPGGGAAVSYPKPSLYALIAFVVALVIALRVAFVLSTRRRGARAPATEG